VRELEMDLEDLPRRGSVPPARLDIVERDSAIRVESRKHFLRQGPASPAEAFDRLGEKLCGVRSGSLLAGVVLPRVKHDPKGCGEGFGMIVKRQSPHHGVLCYEPFLNAPV
jgi:hypothetical protein